MTDFLIAFGSQTGQAETIAKSLKEKAELIGLTPRLHALDENEKKFNLNEEKLCAIVVSSTGDGDAPDNCARFVRRINRNSLENEYLKNLDYVLLGLGDSNYSSYQTIPRKIDKQLTALGANRLFDRAEADDQVGLELEVEPWIEKFFATLASRFDISADKMNAITESSNLKLNQVKTEEEKKALLQKRIEDEESDDEGRGRVIGIDMLIPEHYDYPEISLLKGSQTLSNDENLRVPIAPQPFIVSSVSNRKLPEDTKLEWQNLCKMPGVVTKPFEVLVVSAEFVTDPFSKKIKTKRMITVDFGDHAAELQYEPGDAIYFCVPNPALEVNFILKRCGVLDIADQQCELSINPKTEKINAQIPGHVHKITTLRHMFTTCLDIRRAPGRPLIRVLAESTSDPNEKRRLLELCSAQGMKDFTDFVRTPGLSLADMLFAFPNVKPPVDRLIELLPRLIPRPYSMSSYENRKARLIYSEMEFPATDGRRHSRKGLATDWLNSLRIGDKVQVLGKEPARFRLPPLGMTKNSAGKLPLLMVGPGTGVSVFLSFLHFLRKLKQDSPSDFVDVPRVLFFGCRDSSVDAIYMSELEMFVSEGILTDLIICESEQKGERVQDGLRKYLDKVLPFLTASTESKIFICGDAKGMSKDVWQCFSDIVASDQGIPDLEAKKKLMDLKKSDQYIEDVWG
ncbi:Methionine synthase reductase [Caenorhabditis elegans]|uniref:Methionine synthase reductase n=1 Tax=Caenorhabditis elegans TaxID=6239 RepID=MTRR_CAEEL|nr:Methionine synthase reductase [Caenorhabditis elegans]Q17574.1 RecName: Full=Methionine synthase reductase; Short=MSR [Caenorhabditis elegans]CAA84637.1 Methionine synthase reductase [Caenorhabditis elegans]|eukprot:NP_495978.1 Methionine synthase reductase [Caenorhabditis elegans]